MKRSKIKLTKLLKLGILFIIPLFLWNCQEEETFIIDDNSQAVEEINKSELEISSISIEDFKNNQETKKIFSKISSNLKTDTSILRKSNSKSITVLTDEIAMVKKNDVVTYTFRIEAPTDKFSDFENLMIYKYPDDSFRFMIIKYQYRQSKKDIPYSISFKEVKDNELNNIRGLGNILNKTMDIADCAKIYTEPCRDGESGSHKSQPSAHGGMCGGTTMIVDFTSCFEGGGIDYYSDTSDNNYNHGNDSSTGNGGGGTKEGGTGAVLEPPCDDPIHGCDKMPWMKLANKLNITNQNQIDWVSKSENDTEVQQIYSFLENNKDFENNYTTEAKNFAVEIIEILSNTTLTEQQKLEQFKIADNIFDPYLADNLTQEDYEAKIRHYIKQFNRWGNKEFANYLQSLLPLDQGYAQEDYYKLYETIKNKKAELFLDYFKAIAGQTVESFKPLIEMALLEVGGGLALKVLQKLPIKYLTTPIRNIISRLKVRTSPAFSNLKHAKKYGIKSYDEFGLYFKNELKIKKTDLGVHVHHLFERRFAQNTAIKQFLGKNTGNWKSIVVTLVEHVNFTKSWLREIPRKNSSNPLNTLTASVQDLKIAAKKVYKDYPEILKALGL